MKKMREILFRGKRIDNGEWIEGSLWIFDKFYILTTANCVGFEVDPETVGLYTGMICNGKKIFEGDICRLCLNPEICVGVVEYDERISSFIVKVGETEMLTFIDYFVARNSVGDKVWIEVIGNIHDNPELIGGKNDVKRCE